MKKKVLIFSGGWDGHQPKTVGDILAGLLAENGFDVEQTDKLERLEAGDLGGFDLIVPNWTMGQISGPQCNALMEAVEKGTGLAGLHGGMGDAFRANSGYQFMVGGQFVSHPGNAQTYTVKPSFVPHPITAGISPFEVHSEQYYLHYDPAITVLMTTTAPPVAGPHGPALVVEMPVVWVKMWGKGRVFYSAIGHSPDVVTSQPHFEVVRRGFLWAAR
jgi:type 1 glutamine amidotransferase